jgi:cellulose synthase/poly-beta-1,6-N-acetylglucosamine synthase-like glycosyltransferase
MKVLLLFDALVVLGWVVFCVGLPTAIRRLPRVRATAPTGALRGVRVSVIVPARNEEKLLPRCLDSVRAQRRPVHELIVVDDTSRDATGRVAADRGAHVISAGTRPPGWNGKPWAAHVGANAATGDWLLFVDADAVLAADCVEAALAEAEEHGADLLSLIPAWRCSTLLESLVQPVFFILLSAAFDFHKMNDPANPLATAWGGFLLFRRSAYEKLEGHTAVKDVIVEDLAIAQEVKRRGMKLRVLPAPELVETARPLSPRRIWDDGCRAAFGVAARGALLPVVCAAAVLAIFVGPYLLMPLGPRFVVLAAVNAACALLARVQLGRSVGLDYRLALLQPIGALYVVAVLLWGSVARLSGRAVVQWGARQYRG